MSESNTPERTIDDIAEKAAKALAEFPLPSQNLTAVENYRRVLNWLYSGDVAAMVVGLSYGMKKGEKLRVGDGLSWDTPGYEPP